MVKRPKKARKIKGIRGIEMTMPLKKKPKEVGKIRETVPVAKRLKKIQGTG